jgi:phospholipid/cholesterol/gamma-HCH transport system substrate-binding protein
MHRLAINAAQCFRSLLVLLVAVVLVGCVAVLLRGGHKSGTAYFVSVKNIYPKDRVRILGVNVGEITAIHPEPGRVRVEFTYDSKYDLPSNVQAAIISPTLVATRFMQLTPAYNGGSRFPDGGTIPQDRTASPLEFDDLKTELQQISKAFGPAPDGRQGVLGRFLDTMAKNARGNQGVKFNEMVRQASAAAQSLASGRNDIFATVRNLQTFVTALGAVNQQIVTFNDQLGSVSGLLNENRDTLTQAIAGVNNAAKQVDQFLGQNSKPLETSVDQLGQLTRTLAGERDDIAQVLHVAPNTLTNFWQIFSPRTGAYTGALVVDNLNNPADLVCSAYAANLTHNPGDAAPACDNYLAPLLRVLRIQQPPIGVNPIVVPGGGAPASRPGGDPPPNGTANNQGLPPNLGLPGLGGLIVPPSGGKR